ncbi:MAG: nuclear transport factor 2 family protein [Thermodesulfobacteriota bacterium]
MAGAKAHAAPAPPSAAAEPGPAVRAEIEALMARMAAAYARKDMKALADLADERVEVRVRGLGQDGDYRGREAVRRAFAPQLMALDSPRLDLDRPALAVSGGRAALAAAFTAWSAAELWPGLAASQRMLPVPGRIEAQLERRGQGWVITRLVVLLPGAGRSGR